MQPRLVVVVLESKLSGRSIASSEKMTKLATRTALFLVGGFVHPRLILPLFGRPSRRLPIVGRSVEQVNIQFWKGNSWYFGSVGDIILIDMISLGKPPAIVQGQSLFTHQRNDVDTSQSLLLI